MFTRRPFFALSSRLFGLVFVQCKTEPDAAAEGSGPTRQEFLTAYCELAARCCEGGNKGSGCERELGNVVPPTFDPVAGQACLDAVRANSTGAHFCSKGLFLADVRACAVLSPRGNVPVGGSCNNAVTGVECALVADAHVACVFGEGTMMCQLQEAVGEGASCVHDTNDDGSLPLGASLDVAVTEKGTYCDRSKGLHCIAQKCGKLANVGAACTDYKSCIPSAHCDFETKVCKKRGENGAACVGDVECVSNSCDTKTKRCSSAASPVFLRGLCE